MQMKVDVSSQEPSENATQAYQHSQHHQATASGSGEAQAGHGVADYMEAGGETEQHAHKALKPRGSNHKDAETATSPPHPTTAGDHMAAAGDQTAADLQEGEAGESTPNLGGGTRVPAGHLDHGLPAEGLRMHTEPAAIQGVMDGVTEGVTGTGVSGRAAPTAANASQALNKKVRHVKTEHKG